MISPSLRLMVVRHIFSAVISNNQTFGLDDDVIDIIVRKLTTLLFLPEDYIVR
jgi:hypothetical protein